MGTQLSALLNYTELQVKWKLKLDNHEMKEDTNITISLKMKRERKNMDEFTFIQVNT